MKKYILLPVDVDGDNTHCSRQCVFFDDIGVCDLVGARLQTNEQGRLRDDTCVRNEFDILLVERLLTVAVESGAFSRGLYADAMCVDRCDIDTKIKEVKDREK